MAPLVYKDCIHCYGKGYHFVAALNNRYDGRTSTDHCTYCSGRGWVDIMQKNEVCQTCGGYGWGKAGHHHIAFLKNEDQEKCVACNGTGKQKEQTMEIEHSESKLECSDKKRNIKPAESPDTAIEDPSTQKEVVAHPSHYNCGKIEVIDAIEDWRLGFNDGNVVKYVARHRMKMTPTQDLEKAFWYLTRELMKHHGVTEIRLVEMVRGCIKDTLGTK